MKRNSIRLVLVGCGGVLALLMFSCSPEVGSQTWCEKMVDKPKADWSAKEAADYAENCLFK